MLCYSSPCSNPLDCDNDLNCDRSKRLNDILAGHDIALLKMVKKVAKQTLLILSDNNLTLFLYSRPLSFSSFVKVDMYSRTIVPICLPNPRDSYLINVSSLDHDYLSDRPPTSPLSWVELMMISPFNQEGSSADISGFGVVIEPVSGALKHPTELQTARHFLFSTFTFTTMLLQSWFKSCYRVTLTSKSVCRNWWETKWAHIYV